MGLLCGPGHDSLRRQLRQPQRQQVRIIAGTGTVKPLPTLAPRDFLFAPGAAMMLWSRKSAVTPVRATLFQIQAPKPRQPSQNLLWLSSRLSNICGCRGSLHLARVAPLVNLAPQAHGLWLGHQECSMPQGFLMVDPNVIALGTRPGTHKQAFPAGVTSQAKTL